MLLRTLPNKILSGASVLIRPTSSWCQPEKLLRCYPDYYDYCHSIFDIDIGIENMNLHMSLLRNYIDQLHFLQIS